MGNEMMRESDEVKETEESSDDFNTVTDNLSLETLFAVGFVNPVRNWPDTQCHLQESVNSAKIDLCRNVFTYSE